ncbi:MAG: hypothetical protein ACR2O4_03425, partial [Hyphomicrobiaceae bacterium]
GYLKTPKADSKLAFPPFTGNVRLRGRNLSRFARWLDPSYSKTALAVDGAFGLDGAIEFSSEMVAFRNARGKIRGTRFSGSIEQDRTPAGELALALKSTAVDLTPFIADTRALGDLIRRWTLPHSRTAEGSQASRLANVNLELGRVQVGQTSFADVVVDVRSDGPRLDIHKASFLSAAGLQVEVEGNTTRGDIRNAGNIRFVARAPSEAAFNELVNLTGFQPAESTRTRLSGTTMPLHLAGSVRFGQADDPAIRARLDGTLAGNPTVARIRIEGDAPDLGARAWNVSADMTVADTAATLAQLGWGATSREKSSNGRLIAYAVGTPGDGLKTTIGLKSAHLNATYEGAIDASTDGLRIDG